MLANSTNLRRAGLLLRALSEASGWTAGVFLDARKIAKEKAVAGTERELADVESFLVDQGWLKVDSETERGASFYAVTRHGLDESQRKMPAEPKVYKPQDRQE